jgi:hypothetical protein
MKCIKARAIKIIATTGQYVLLTPLFPFYCLHIVGEKLLELSAWSTGNGVHGLRPWAARLMQWENALDEWRSKSLASLRTSPTSQDKAST